MQQQWPTIPRSDQKLKRFSPYSHLIFESIAQGKKQDDGIKQKSAPSNSDSLFALKRGEEVVEATASLVGIALVADRQPVDSIDAKMAEAVAQQAPADQRPILPPEKEAKRP